MAKKKKKRPAGERNTKMPGRENKLKRQARAGSSKAGTGLKVFGLYSKNSEKSLKYFKQENKIITCG